MILVDTSAWLSLHDEDDRHHAAAALIWRRLMTEQAALCSTVYVRLETWSLLQARFGLEPVRRFDRAHLPVVDWLEVSETRFAPAKPLGHVSYTHQLRPKILTLYHRSHAAPIV